MAASVLYLDTARLGQTSPSALQAQIDFSRLTAEQPSSLYTDRFLQSGIKDAPSCWQERFPGLSNWHGVTELLQAIKAVAGAPDDHEVAVASRSTALMRSAVYSMYRLCRNVLTTDFAWPAYRAELCDAARRSNNRITYVECREDAFAENISLVGLADRIASAYDRNKCDGLFLPLIDNLGFKLPIGEIITRISSIRKPRFILIDGAQTLGHVPSVDCHDLCDVFLAGSHKWIRAGIPLGIATFGQPRSRDVLRAVFKSDDPLSCFVSSLSTGQLQRYSETVNVVPLLACRAASADIPVDVRVRQQRWTVQLHNRDKVATLAELAGWQPLLNEPEAQTGILVLRPSESVAKCTNGECLRATLADCGVAASTYSDASIRLSMPQVPLDSAEMNQIGVALTSAQKVSSMSTSIIRGYANLGIFASNS